MNQVLVPIDGVIAECEYLATTKAREKAEKHDKSQVWIRFAVLASVALGQKRASLFVSQGSAFLLTAIAGGIRSTSTLGHWREPNVIFAFGIGEDPSQKLHQVFYR